LKSQSTSNNRTA